jgi:hypothetical protein
MITPVMIDHWFSYHAPETQEDLKAYEDIRECGRALALTILKHTPGCADQSAAIRLVRQAVWSANAAKACKGR